LIGLARYVAFAARYDHGIGEPTISLVNGLEMETTKKRIARFQQGVLLDHEVEVGLKTFTFKGLADGVEPFTRLSVFDTRDYQKANRLTDEEREKIEAILESAPAFGAEFIKVEEITAPLPFPSYDEKEPEEILEIVESAGIEPDVAYRYEAENLARKDLMEAFATLGAADVGAPKELDVLALPEGDNIIPVVAA
jgi:hypothetical protein